MYGAEHSKCNHKMTLGFKGLNTLAAAELNRSMHQYVNTVRKNNKTEMSK